MQIFAVLKCTTVENHNRTEHGPIMIDSSTKDYLKTPEDNVDETFEWLFFDDRKQLIDAGYTL